MKEIYELLKIVNVEKYGIFVKIGENKNALCHSTKLQKKIEQYQVGEYIWGKEIDSEIEGKYSVMECPPVEKNALFEEYIAMHSEGDVVKGYVINTDERNGASVQMLYSVISLVNINLGMLQIWVAVAGLISVLATVALTLLLSARFKNVVVSLAMSLMVCILSIVIYIALPTQIATWINAFTPSSGVGLMTSILYSLIDFIFLNVGNVSVWLPYVMIGAGIIEIPVFILGAVRNYIVYSK